MKLDMHCEMILDEYRERLPLFERIKDLILERLRTCLDENHIIVDSKHASRQRKA